MDRNVASAGYEAVDHTADVALRVWAPRTEELFRQAALGLLELLAGSGAVQDREAVAVSVAGIDLEELMIAWLNEILYLSDTGPRRFADLRGPWIEKTPEEYRLRATLRGEAFDTQRHAGGVGVKAATYHDLRIEPEAKDGYDITLVLDT